MSIIKDQLGYFYMVFPHLKEDENITLIQTNGLFHCTISINEFTKLIDEGYYMLVDKYRYIKLYIERR